MLLSNPQLFLLVCFPCCTLSLILIRSWLKLKAYYKQSSMLIPVNLSASCFSFFKIPNLESYQKQASTLIWCHHPQMPTLLIFGIKVSPLCRLCGVGPLWSPDQRRLCPQMTLTELQAAKEGWFYLFWNKVHKKRGGTLGCTCFYRSDRVGQPLDWWGQQPFSVWLRLREKEPRRVGVLAVTAGKKKFN